MWKYRSEKCLDVIGTSVGRRLWRAGQWVVIRKKSNVYRILVVKQKWQGLNDKPRRSWENDHQVRRGKISTLWRLHWLRIASYFMTFIGRDIWSISVSTQLNIFIFVSFIYFFIHSLFLSSIYSFVLSFIHNSEK